MTLDRKQRVTRIVPILTGFILAIGTALAQVSTAPSTPAAGATGGSMYQATPAADSRVQSTVVEEHDNSGKWGLVGLLGLLGLAGLRRREGEVTVVDRGTPRSPTPPATSGPTVNRR
jgi:MYXO-CTERM domain-containing protein